MKALAIVYYITNYATKRNYSQYQRIMAVVIVRKVFEDQDKSGPGPFFNMPTLDKFLLKAFNSL